MNYKLLLFDVDDTVCPSTKIISDEGSVVINRLIAEGTLFGFISGSTVDQIYGQLNPKLQGTYWLVGTSGSRAERVHDGKREILFNIEIPKEERERIISVLHELTDTFKIHSLTTKEDQIQDRLSQITLSAIGRYAPSDEKRAFDPDRTKRTEWVHFIENKIGKKYNIKIGGTTSIDITPKAIDKATGTLKLLEVLHLKQEDVLFFGDQLQEGGNDAVMKTIVECKAVKNPEETIAMLKKFK